MHLKSKKKRNKLLRALSYVFQRTFFSVTRAKHNLVLRATTCCKYMRGEAAIVNGLVVFLMEYFVL